MRINRYFNLVGKKNGGGILCLFLLLCLIVQIVLICTYGGYKQLSDYGVYIRLASKCFENGTWYPSANNLHDSYIFAPGLINWFILQMKIFGTLKINMWLNLLMNIGITYFIYALAEKWFGLRTARISVILWSLLYSVWWSVIPAGTEVPFLFLALFALWLTTTRPIGWLIIAGIAFALSNWIRPLVIIFVITAIIILYRRKTKPYGYVLLISGYALTIFIIGSLAQSSFGYFVTQSSTSGVNLIYTANDKAYGGVASSLTNDSTNICYIKNAEGLTYAEKDSIWKSRAIEWIKQHPGRYAYLYLIKIPGLFVEDTWPDRSVLPGAGFIDKYAHGQIPTSQFIVRAVTMASKSFVYYIVCILFVIGLIRQRKDILSDKGILLITLLLGVEATCLFSVSPRYHYPFLFIIVIWAAYTIDRFFTKGYRK